MATDTPSPTSSPAVTTTHGATTTRGANNADRTPDAGLTGDASSLSRNWWTFALRGALAILIAMLAFVAPGAALFALALTFGAFAFADGVLELVAAVRRMRKGERWGWLLFSGVLGVLAGIAVLVAPMVATILLASFVWAAIAFWSIATGASQIVAAVRLRREIEGEVWLGLSGLVSVLLGAAVVLLMFTRPIESLLALGWLLGSFAALYGAFLIMLGFRLRRARAAA